MINQEVEIKIKLLKEEFETIKGKIQNIGQLLSSSLETDVYYNSPNRNFLTQKNPVEYLRVRHKNNSGKFTYKYAHMKSSKLIKLDEYETKVNNPEQVNNILLALNFTKLICIDKYRETYSFMNDFEISLDNIKELGYFIEIEAKNDTKISVEDIAKNLGLDPKTKDKEGYVILMLKQKGLLNRNSRQAPTRQ